MRENTETKQRLADYRLERAVWSDANLGNESKELSFEQLGGRCILQPTPLSKGKKPVDFSSVYGDTGKRISIAPEESKDDDERPR